MTDDTDGTVTRLKRPLRYVMGGFYVIAGVLHFVVPDTYARIVPPQFPRPLTLVYLSGIAEISLGIGVVLPRTRRRSAWGLVALLLAVFPANIHMATHDMVPDAVPDRASAIARVALWARLPLQGVLLLWAWWYARPPRTQRNSAETTE
ncbi:MAG TPA: DoxX family membrane protein [Halococcus sp.]|nr:DoxX family membrane protein [Halococcus sp.]